jgi:predicted nucleic acid-binding protein
MRRPASVLVVDAAILLAGAIGRNSASVLSVASRRTLITTARAVAESRRRIELGLRAPQFLLPLEQIVEPLTIAPAGALSAHIPAAEKTLRASVASRNGSIADAHILACAWEADADIWSFDRDFAGTGVASWSTANLLRALAEEDAG